MYGTSYFTVRVSPATDVASVINRVQRALHANGASSSVDTLSELLTDTATRFQNELGNSGTHGETLLDVAGIRIKITTAEETPVERLLSAVFKNRITFV